jgi:serine/threonine protein kinase
VKDGDLIDHGRYRVQSLLGQGGMGQVYRAHDSKLNKVVAIKVLFPNTPEQVIKRFHTEAKALAKLNHPNIMSINDFGQAENGQLYLVMDYLKGDSLSSMIESRGPQTFSDILPIFVKICRGLRYAHMNGVLHRDIKPSNVMLAVDRSKDDGVKLVDFGLAKANDQAQDLTKTGAAMGSPPYMSPESVHGKETDERSDIYSLGCTLFEMMAGVPPFVGETPFHTMMAQVNRHPPTLEQACEKPFDEEVEEFVQKFIKKNPDARFQNMDEVVAELERVEKALSDKRRASEGLLASGIYASGAFIKNRIEDANNILKGALIPVVAGIMVAGVGSYFLANSQSAKTSEGHDDALRAMSNLMETHKGMEKKALSSIEQGLTSYRQGATIKRDKDSDHDVCVLSGTMNTTEFQAVVDRYARMTCFQLEALDVPDNCLNFVCGFAVQKLIIANMPVTDSLMKKVGGIKVLEHLRITDCGQLPQGCLDRLKSSRNLMTTDIDCGKAYKDPALPFARMPNLIWPKFRNSTISREDMKALSTIPKMKWLQFKNCDFAPGAISKLKAIPTCTRLSISQTNLTEEQYQELAQLHFIEALTINDTNVDDEQLQKLKSMKKLFALDVKNTPVTDEGVATLVKGMPLLTSDHVFHGRKTHDVF